jgi:hypothetical protein
MHIAFLISSVSYHLLARHGKFVPSVLLASANPFSAANVPIFDIRANIEYKLFGLLAHKTLLSSPRLCASAVDYNALGTTIVVPCAGGKLKPEFANCPFLPHPLR